jgi:hypothetical protein
LGGGARGGRQDDGVAAARSGEAGEGDAELRRGWILIRGFGDLGFTVVCVFFRTVGDSALWALLTGGRNGEICLRGAPGPKYLALIFSARASA